MNKGAIRTTLIFGIMLVLLGTSIGTGLSISANTNTKTASPTNTSDEWFENFDDGNISDWTILNPEKPGDQPITLELTTNQSHSPQYSMFLNSPHTGNPDFSARAYGPNVPLDPNQPHTIEFWFRWNDFHWVHFAGFGYLATLIDYPSLQMNFMDDKGYHYLGPAFSSYCPKNTWTHFKFEVEPSVSNISLYVNDIFILTFHYDLKTPDETKFNIRDPGAGANDYFDHCYYDDIKVEGTSLSIYIIILSPQQNLWNPGNVTISGMAQSAMGTIINVSLVIDGGYLRYATINGINWNYVWDSKNITDGEHEIIASCKDDLGNYTHTPPYIIKTDNSGPKIYMLFPINNTLTIFGRPFPFIPVNIMIGMCPIYIHIVDEFCGELWSEDPCKFDLIGLLFDRHFKFIPEELSYEPGVYKFVMQGIPFLRLGPCELQMTAVDKLGNENSLNYHFIKIL